MKTNPKLIFGIIAIVVLLIIFFVIYKNSKKVVITKSGTTVQQTGFLDTLTNLFTPKGTTKGTSSSGAGGNASALWCKIFPKSCGIHSTTSESGYTLVGSCVDGCDSGNPGKDCNGFSSSQC